MTMSPFAVPETRRASVAVEVGGVIVGGGAPVVVQSMTNTGHCPMSTAPSAQVAALHRAGFGNRSDHRRSRRERSGSAPDSGSGWNGSVWMCRSSAISTISATRCWPTHPACAEALAKYRIKSRQCRLQGQEGPPVRRDRRDGHPPRQAGAHRRQLGLARPGALDPADGRERRQRLASFGPRRYSRKPSSSQLCIRRPLPRRPGLPATASSCRPR